MDWMDGYLSLMMMMLSRHDVKENKCGNLGLKSECYVYFKKYSI